MPSIVTPLGMKSWSILGGTEMECDILFSTREPLKYRCDVHQPPSSMNPNPKSELSILPVEVVIVLKNKMDTQAGEHGIKFSLGTKTKCEVSKGVYKEKGDDVTYLVCTDFLK